MDMAYWLFSHTKTTGSFQMAAIFRLSWKLALLAAPSPKKETTTLPLFCNTVLNPAPTERGMPPETMPVGPQTAQGKVSHVHGSPLPWGTPTGLGQKFSHHALDILALSDGMAVAPVGGGDSVVRAQGSDGADRGGFLADAQVHGAVDLARRILLEAPFELADQLHFIEHLSQGFRERLIV